VCPYVLFHVLALASPVISSIQPTLGIVDGGDIIMIVGDNFVDEPGAACIFGGDRMTPAQWVSASKLTCVVPSLLRDEGDPPPPAASFSVEVLLQRRRYRAAQNFTAYGRRILGLACHLNHALTPCVSFEKIDQTC
jgi:hypothetical protein